VSPYKVPKPFVFMVGIASGLYAFLAYEIARTLLFHGGTITISVNHFGEGVFEVVLLVILAVASAIATVYAYRWSE